MCTCILFSVHLALPSFLKQNGRAFVQYTFHLQVIMRLSISYFFTECAAACMVGVFFWVGWCGSQERGLPGGKVGRRAKADEAGPLGPRSIR